MNTTGSDRTNYGAHDFADFAQEFLRRNPDYRAQYARLDEAASLTPGSSTCTGMARSWGLEFPVSS